MRCSRYVNVGGDTKWRTETLEEVDYFKYLGSRMEDGEDGLS